MKLIITRKEVDALIRGSFDLPSDAEIEIVESEKPTIAADPNGFIINTQTEPFPPYTIDGNELLDVIYSNGDVRLGLPAYAWTNSWNVNNKMHIVKYRKHRG